MPSYIVNRNAQFDSGDNEVHIVPRSSCPSPRYPEPENQEPLGSHPSCQSAVQEAKRRGYRNANGCYYCSLACHTG